jgi:serine/threonine-protein kinase
MSSEADQSGETPDKYVQLVRQARRQAETARQREEQTASLPPGMVSAERLWEPGQLPSPDSLPGYELLREIHRGGQGVVYQAIQKATKRKVAIKVMREGPFAGPHGKARFEREVQVLAQLKHPSIVGVLDSGEVAGWSYFVMDYVSGQPLGAYLASARPAIPDLLRLFARICDAVHQAHLHGVIHRDLKPGNIRIDAEGEPHVLDFGLARVAGGQYGGEDARAMTVTGQFVGTLPYASSWKAMG